MPPEPALFPKYAAHSCVIKIRRLKRFSVFYARHDALSRVTVLSRFCRCIVTFKLHFIVITYVNRKTPLVIPRSINENT